MIALPFHPSKLLRFDYLYEKPRDILRETEKAADQVAEGRAHFTLLDKITKGGKLQVQQGIIAGCAGGNYTNVVEAAHALKGKNIGDGEFYLSVYPSSQPVYTDLDRKGLLADLMDAGAIIRSASADRASARRYPGQQRAFHPSYYQKLPEPRRLQAG